MSSQSPAAIAAKRASRVGRSVTEVGSLDFAALQASDLQHGTTVLDRIRQWQDHGAASAPPPDTVSVLSIPRSQLSTLDDPAQHGDSQYDRDDRYYTVDLEELGPRQKGRSTKDRTHRIRSASTPRKRVISDEHWKMHRAHESHAYIVSAGQDSIESELTNTNALRSHSPRSTQQAKAEREERRRRRTEVKPRREREPRHQPKDFVRERGDLYPDPNLVITSAASIRDFPLDPEDIDDANTYPAGTGESVLEFDSNPGSDEDNHHKLREPSRYVEVLGKPPPAYRDPQVRSKKGSLLNKTKEVLGIAIQPQMMSNRLPSIEAWLDDQPGSSIGENPTSGNVQETELRLPKQRSVQRKTPKPDVVPLDPNKIWDSISSPVVRQEPNRPLSMLEDPESAATIGLKRRGARASRQKRHTLTHIPVEMEATLSEIKPQPQETSGEDVKSLVYEQDQQQQHRQRSCPQVGPTKLSTIASVETFHEKSQEAEQIVEEDKSKLSNDANLSRRAQRRSTRKKRNTRTIDCDQNTDPIKQILETLVEEQEKYCRELRTLIDGVIPVLLQCVLSKSDAVAAAGLFTNRVDLHHDASFNRPIIDMGIALERIKTLHKRMRCHDIDAFFSWCQTAHKAYSEYVQAWRLGFQDVVINLAPIDDSGNESSEVMARDVNGDVVNSEGETVDIAYLMKRPLVNIRKIGRILGDLEAELPDHPVATKIASDYRELTAAAKNKHQQEKARLEDEAAALIDATRCRDIRSLGPLPAVTIDQNKRVRARDCFDLTLFHSTGQRLDCKIEIILRDNSQVSPDGGDLLVCQIDEAGKWLLFAPVSLGNVSARRGESGCDLVIMLRGRAGINDEWRELLALKADEPEATSEWLIMLGSNPLPPKLSRVPSFVSMNVEEPKTHLTETPGLTKALLRRVSSAETIDVPIGEPSLLGVVSSKEESLPPDKKRALIDKPLPQLNLGGGLQRKEIPEHWQSQRGVSTRDPSSESAVSSGKSTISSHSAGSGTIYTPSSLAPMAHNPPRLQRQQQQQGSPRVNKEQPKIPQIPMPSHDDLPSVDQSPGHLAPSRDQKPLQNRVVKDSSSKSQQESHPVVEKSISPSGQQASRRALPPIPLDPISHSPKLRSSSSPNVSLTEGIRERWSSISGFGRKADVPPIDSASQTVAPALLSKKEISPERRVSETDAPVQKEISKKDKTAAGPKSVEDVPPPPPQHKLPVLAPRSRNVPTLGPSEAQKKMDREKGRISYSPLRNEYTASSPSTSDNSSSELSSSSESDSQTSDEGNYEQHVPPKPRSAAATRQSYQMPPVYARSAPTSGTRTLAPSDSASQGPYRRVPSSQDRPDAVKKHAIAMICSWNDKGIWEPLVDGYCSIVVSHGLMEAFVMDEAHSNPEGRNQRPLAAFELTPMVPLRKPTGLDINIRSPPTPDSQIKTSSNIMFRSHSALECENLYQMINWARNHNPTYLELERSRPRVQPAVTFSDQQAPRPRSWWSFGSGIKRRNSYRVGNVPPSSMGESQATANTASSRMSAIKRLTKSSAFNINRSSVIRRPGIGTGGSLYSSSNGTGVDSGSSTPPLSQLGHIPGEEGPNAPPTSADALNGGGMVHNKLIRLQIRRPNGTWEMIGPSKLTILPAVKRSEESPEASRPGSSGSVEGGGNESSHRTSTTTGSVEPTERQYRLSSSHYTPHRLHGGGREKRIVITWTKDPSRILLDATLGESCFEKLSPVSIAVQVWKADDEVRSRGGVNLGQNTTYKLIFKRGTDCAWVFGMLGKYRYGNTV